MNRKAGSLSAQYVALGSSFAAGIGLGPRASGSPFLCMRSINGYPQQLARLAGLSLVDATCSGATAKHVLRGGQFFQPAQLDAVNTCTEIVTLTVGGNDVDYIRDLLFCARRARKDVSGALLRRFWRGPRPAEKRDFAGLRRNFDLILEHITARAPGARTFVVTYPSVLPPSGTCPKLGITAEEAQIMREVAQRLADVTRTAANIAGADLVDMASLSAGHDACAAAAWVHGAEAGRQTPFHPTLSGADATAREILRRIAPPSSEGA